jgi:hypothetical protein
MVYGLWFMVYGLWNDILQFKDTFTPTLFAYRSILSVAIQSFNHSIIQSSNHSIIQSSNHPIIQSFNHPIIQSFNLSIFQSSKTSVKICKISVTCAEPAEASVFVLNL